MSDKIKKVPYNNPSLLPIGEYDIDIKRDVDITMPNSGEYGGDSGNWSIITQIDSKNGVIMVDLVTLKKALDFLEKYPDMNKNEVFSICQLVLSKGELTVIGDIVKVTKSK